jgi:hypothetical protein
MLYAGESVSYRSLRRPVRNSAAIASWLLFLFACVGAMVPGLGFGIWLIIVPILVITLVLGILSINRGSAFHGVVIILMSLIVVPVFVLVVPFVSTAIAIESNAAADTADADESSPEAVLPSPDPAALMGDVTATPMPTQETSLEPASADDATAVAADAPLEAAAPTDTETTAASLAAVPRFDAYPPTRMFDGQREPAVIETIEERQNQQSLEAASQDAPNFAGEYNLTLWRCGDDCITGAAVNLSNGKVVFLPFTEGQWKGSGAPFRYRRDSRLLVVGGVLSEQGPYGAHFFTLDDDDGFALVSSVRAPVPMEEGMD